MKKLLIIAVGALIISCNNKTESKVKYSDLVNDNLKGDVASVQETPYKVDSATGQIGAMDTCCVDKWDYNEKGFYTKTVSRNDKGEISSETEVSRFDNGLWKGTKNSKNGKVVFAMDSKLDDKGDYKVVESTDSTGKRDYYYTDIAINEYGQVLHWKQYDKDSVYRMEGESKYDKNLWLGFTGKDSVGKMKSSTTVKYNDKGEDIEESNTNVTKDSTTTHVTKYTYDTHDDMGNWTQRTEWNDKGKAVKIIKREYTYRNKGTKK